MLFAGRQNEASTTPAHQFGWQFRTRLVHSGYLWISNKSTGWSSWFIWFFQLLVKFHILSIPGCFYIKHGCIKSTLHSCSNSRGTGFCCSSLSSFARMVMFHIHIHVDWRESIYNSMNYLRWLTKPQKLIKHQEPNTTTSCLCSQLGKHFRNRVVGQNLKMFFGTHPQPLKDIPPPSWLRDENLIHAIIELKKTEFFERRAGGIYLEDR